MAISGDPLNLTDFLQIDDHPMSIFFRYGTFESIKVWTTIYTIMYMIYFSTLTQAIFRYPCASKNGDTYLYFFCKEAVSCYRGFRNFHRFVFVILSCLIKCKIISKKKIGFKTAKIYTQLSEEHASAYGPVLSTSLLRYGDMSSVELV